MLLAISKYPLFENVKILREKFLRLLMKCFILISFFLLNGPKLLLAQPCTTLGQNPNTAFPVCGTSVFNQSSIPICGNNPLVSACNTGTTFTDKNPYWYKFKCFVAGSLGFVISPNNQSDDYDWQLFDITGRNPADVYTDRSMFVACNWSGYSGNTGASAAGTSLIECDGQPIPLFSAMPNLILNHEYLLLISHFNDSQSGYSLSFTGGTAVITDPTDPHLQSASATCDGTKITVKLNKKMKCSSVASRWQLSSGSTSVSSNIISVNAVGCTSNFDTDSILLTLDNPLSIGSYFLAIKTGTDGNTVLDNCERAIPDGESIPLTIYPIQPTPMDSLTKVGCASQQLELVFRKAIKCSSIAANASDFSITGSYPINISSINTNCSNGYTYKIVLQLSTPLYRAGNFQIKLQRGTDGNTIVDECGQETPAGSFIPFVAKDTVNADFTYNIHLGCVTDVVDFFQTNPTGITNYYWDLDEGQTSTIRNPVANYRVFGNKNIKLIVTNGLCADTSYKTISLDNTLKAMFEGSTLICPDDKATFSDASLGQIAIWKWNFGNGNTYNGQIPPDQYYNSLSNSNYDVPVSLTVENSLGCTSTITKNITIIWNCYIAVPSAFTPNGDGLNDYLYPLNAYKAAGLKFSVYDRLGQKIFYTEDWTKKWDGTIKGKKADTGTYIWILSYLDTDTNTPVFLKGSTLLIH